MTPSRQTFTAFTDNMSQEQLSTEQSIFVGPGNTRHSFYSKQLCKSAVDHQQNSKADLENANRGEAE